MYVCACTGTTSKDLYPLIRDMLDRGGYVVNVDFIVQVHDMLDREALASRRCGNCLITVSDEVQRIVEQTLGEKAVRAFGKEELKKAFDAYRKKLAVTRSDVETFQKERFDLATEIL